MNNFGSRAYLLLLTRGQFHTINWHLALIFLSMKKNKLFQWVVISLVCGVTHLYLIPSAYALKDSNPKVKKLMGNDEDEFIFSGRCHNGQIYRLVSYQAEVNGVIQFFYDYEGPVGKGTVQTKASPKTMAVRICRALAEIAND